MHILYTFQHNSVHVSYTGICTACFKKGVARMIVIVRVTVAPTTIEKIFTFQENKMSTKGSG